MLRMVTVSGSRNVWIMWLKVLGPEVDHKENVKEVVEEDIQSLKVNKEDAVVFWRRLIRSTEGG